jgi:hypothetical protein
MAGVHFGNEYSYKQFRQVTLIYFHLFGANRIMKSGDRKFIYTLKLTQKVAIAINLPLHGKN